MRSAAFDVRAIAKDWYSFELSIAKVARKHRCSDATVNRAWKVASIAGLIPNIRRPTARDIACICAASADYNAAATASVPDFNKYDPLDGRSVVIPPGDPLLAALRREHGGDPRRCLDTLRLCRFSDRVLGVLASLMLVAS